MYIRIYKNETNLINLTAYSYSINEIDEVWQILNDYSIRFLTSKVPNDIYDRKGLNFKIEQEDNKKFQDRLNIKFLDGKPHFNMSGSPYKCKELSRTSKGKGCETILAEDKNAARIICSSYIAPLKRWFSSYPEIGECDEKNSFW
jgi:hypothetical protein